MKFAISLLILFTLNGCTTIYKVNDYFFGEVPESKPLVYIEPSCNLTEAELKSGNVLFRTINGKMYIYTKHGDLCILKI